MKKFLSQLQRNAAPVILSEDEKEAINTELFKFIESVSDRNDASKIRTIQALIDSSLAQLERPGMGDHDVARAKFMIQQLQAVIKSYRSKVSKTK